VSLSGHNIASSAGAANSNPHLWNSGTHDDKPASENKHRHPLKDEARSSLVQLACLEGLSSAPPSESKIALNSRSLEPTRRRLSFSAKDALKDALAAENPLPYSSIHPPSSLFASATPASPLSLSPRSSFSATPSSLPPLSATLASLHSASSSHLPYSLLTSSPSRSRSSFSAPASSSREPPTKRLKLEQDASSPSSSPRSSFSTVASAPLMDDPPEDAQLIPVTAHIPQGEICIHIEKPVLDALTASGISPESIVNLIVQNDKESREQVIRETGFSTNYIMKLQRRVLHSSSQLQLPPPVRHSFAPGTDLHVLFDSEGGPLFMKKELCSTLGMKGTTFSYWKKKSNVEDTDTSKDFRLMDICRTLFGGRATYTLYSPEATLTILNEMETSRQKNTFTNLAGLKYLVVTYQRYGQKATKILADPNHAHLCEPLLSVATFPTIASSPFPSDSYVDATVAITTRDGPSAAADAVSAAHSAAC
jgi:hypothetical protein